ncbi:MAG: zinc-binding dehydrogenase [Candidatus Micrarchaeota archaeon]|nr:zinc-binding dehydrogenase [Candidatus Micrarchaeota archaeon]MDE1834383.1 zinc-binding dehydrogenase [Candidatus Micrarchaeota archaeon]MDE1859690.1 zinc-binding dehydrogenase [Candidatus Micrarchaeota archaeon]
MLIITTSSEKAKDALRLGANKAIIIGNSEEMLKHSGSFDLIIDTASSKHDLGRFLELPKRNGKMVMVGLPSQPLEIRPFLIVDGHRILAGSGLGGIKGTQEMLDYCEEYGIVSDVEVIPIQKVNEAYERIIKGDVKYMFVIDMSSI